MDDLIRSLENMIAWVTPSLWIIVPLALVFNGFLCVIGTQKGKEKAKEAIPWVVIGAVLVLGATTLSQEFISNIAF